MPDSKNILRRKLFKVRSLNLLIIPVFYGLVSLKFDLFGVLMSMYIMGILFVIALIVLAFQVYSRRTLLFRDLRLLIIIALSFFSMISFKAIQFQLTENRSDVMGCRHEISRKTFVGVGGGDFGSWKSSYLDYF